MFAEIDLNELCSAAQLTVKSHLRAVQLSEKAEIKNRVVPAILQLTGRNKKCQ